MSKKLKLSLKGGGTCLTNSLLGREHLENTKHLENINIGARKIWMILKFCVNASSSLKPVFTGNWGTVNHATAAETWYCYVFCWYNYEGSISFTILRHKIIQKVLGLSHILTHSLPKLVVLSSQAPIHPTCPFTVYTGRKFTPTNLS